MSVSRRPLKYFALASVFAAISMTALAQNPAAAINVNANASLTVTNIGLNNGTLYDFVVSARPTSFAPTQLGFANAGNQLQLNWPEDHTGWLLQSQTNSLTSGLGTNWSNVADSTETNLMTLPVNAADDAVFFRLMRS
ncbi:MAG TPA: hypothetical protein PKA41_13120 [Verrucomicrobiota bacterium]|mgnify:CR=1 FL=1|nr:hypothetical protein [Verrucomicrobiota bacterium]